jgi:chromate transporter
VLLAVGAALIIFFKLHPAYVVIIAAIIGIIIL